MGHRDIFILTSDAVISRLDLVVIDYYNIKIQKGSFNFQHQYSNRLHSCVQEVKNVLAPPCNLLVSASRQTRH